ncbi:MAG: HD domain-containing protein [bacterium]
MTSGSDQTTDGERRDVGANQRITTVPDSETDNREETRKKVERLIREKRRPSPKFIRDPIHDIIKIEDDLVLKILDCPAMQRLREIRQLGTAYLVYPCAEHTRFVHSLGVYHLSDILMTQLDNAGQETSTYDKFVVRLAALLHDIGHGPFSHLFEAAIKRIGYESASKHLEWSKKMVMEYPPLVRLLDGYDESLKKDVVGVLSNSYKPLHLGAIVSSQLDVDRFDYMLRDSYMTGVNYGRFDLKWVLRNLSLKYVDQADEDGRVEGGQRISLDATRGLSSLEEFFLGNLNLYEHVYYHKTVQAAGGMIISILAQAIRLLAEGKNLGIKCSALSIIANGENLEVDDYLELTDGAVISWLRTWSRNAVDSILTDLSQKYLARDLFKAVETTDLNQDAYYKLRTAIEEKLQQDGLDPDYYLVAMDSERLGYKPLSPEEIYVTRKDGNTMRYSDIIKEKGHKISEAIVTRLLHQRNLLVLPDKYVAFAEAEKVRLAG